MVISFLSTHADRQGVDISLTVCLFDCNFIRLRISPAKIKVAASNFARWFRGVLGRESPIWGELCSTIRPKSDESATHPEIKFRVGRAPVIACISNYQYRAACVCRIGMCGYTAVREDGRTLFILHIMRNYRKSIVTLYGVIRYWLGGSSTAST